MLLYFIRHGDPIYEPDSLTELGKKQAEALAERLLIEDIDEIYCSTSNRAIMTAEPLMKMLTKSATLFSWAHEQIGWDNLSTYDENGIKRWPFCIQKYRDLFNSDEVVALGDKWFTHPAFKNDKFDVEYYRVKENADKFFLSLGFKHIDGKRHFKFIGEKNKKEKRIAFFAHGGFGASFLSYIFDYPYNLFSTRFEFGTSQITLIKFDENEEEVIPRFIYFGESSHLYKAKLLKESSDREIKEEKE